jgi:L-threonylcarbamoyladenylate synthase
MILDGGPCAVGIESTILDLSGDRARILRPGMLDAAAIAAVLGYPPAWARSGVRRGFRVPSKPTMRRPPSCNWSRRRIFRRRCGPRLAAGRRVAVLADPQLLRNHPGIACHPASPDPVRFAHDLYAALRELDALGGDLILVAAPPEEEAWRAVNDRLRRAAAGSK